MNLKLQKNMFFNATYNYGTAGGESRYVWGIKELDFSKRLKDQIMGDESESAFNFNLTSLNKVGFDDVSVDYSLEMHEFIETHMGGHPEAEALLAKVRGE